MVSTIQQARFTVTVHTNCIRHIIRKRVPIPTRYMREGSIAYVSKLPIIQLSSNPISRIIAGNENGRATHNCELHRRA